MNITNKVTEKFKVICPTSASKCTSVSEIHYKITRAVNLGKKSKVNANGIYVVEYHNLKFFVRSRTKAVTNMFFLKGVKRGEPHYFVDEEIKRQYDLIHRKNVVEKEVESVIVKKEIKSVNFIKLAKEKVNVYKGFLKAVFQ
jgi:hypothetical protein